MTRRDRTIFCKHYRAMAGHDTCEAGVPYSKFDSVKFDDRPCFCRNGKQNGGCELMQFPTAEEIEEQDRAIGERLLNVASVRHAIVEHLGGPWKRGTKGASGTIKCPVCKSGEVHFSRSGFNGHIHAKCSTDGCVAWIE